MAQAGIHAGFPSPAQDYMDGIMDLNKELVRYAVRLSDRKLARRDRLYLTSTFRSIADLERVGRGRAF